MKKLILMLVAITLALQTYAQKPRKFGEVTKEEIGMSIYKPDTSAKAVVIYDFGKSTIGYGPNGFKVTMLIHEIVKIYEDDEFDRGDITIQYPSGSAVQRLKATTYNLIDGEIVKSELSKKDIYQEKVTDGLMKKKFSMPDLAPGSVIEYTYTINSGSLSSFTGWYFQSTIPVIWSEYRISYPNWFNYKTIARGYLSFSINDSKPISVNIGGDNVSGTSKRFVIKNAPAFKMEKYLTTRENYMSKMDFELASISIPSTTSGPGYYKDYFTDFESIRKTLIDDSNFGTRLNDAKFLASDINSIKTSSKSQEEELTKLYELIRDHVNWNDRYSKYGDLSAKKVYAGEEANSSEINLLLVSLLRQAGYTANPLILSTRKHGTVHSYYPLIKKYNHVICWVKVEETQYLLDATDELVPFGMLPAYNLNGQGRVISENWTDWIDLSPVMNSRLAVNAEFELTEEGLLEGTARTEYSGYAAISKRHEIEDEGLENYKKDIEKRAGWIIDEIELENLDDINKPVIQEITATLEDNAQGMSNVIYLTPVLTNRNVENPFKMDKRLYPVDYTYPRITSGTFKITIPTDFSIEEQPADIELKLLNNAGKYTFSSTIDGDELIINSVFEISKVTFQTKDYKALQSFYDAVIAKQAEQFVIKRLTE